MDRLSALIVDDEGSALENMELCLENFCPNIQPVYFARSIEQALEVLKDKDVDLMFLDVRLGQATGFDLLSKTDDRLPVIFTTAYEEYALKALKYGALDYLLKPINPRELIKAVKKAGSLKDTEQTYKRLEETFLKQQLEKLAIPGKEMVRLSSVEDILYCQARDNYTVFHLKKGETIIVAKTLKEFDQVLKKEGFMRIHQSYLVNTVHITGYDKKSSCVLLNPGIELPVSRSKKQLLRQFLNAFSPEN